MTTTTALTAWPGPTDPEVRWREYQICQARGHQNSVSFSITMYGGPTRNYCRFCGTVYWTETVEHEENVPEEPERNPA